MTAEDVIRLLELVPLEGEGGFYRQVWANPDPVTGKPHGTCIYYLVTPESFSTLHRLTDDEIFHFYLGDPCEAVTVSADGTFDRVTLGHRIDAGMRVQHIVPAGSWQATRLVPGGTWALLGTTMAPGFTSDGFESATLSSLDELPHDVRIRVREFVLTPA